MAAELIVDFPLTPKRNHDVNNSSAAPLSGVKFAETNVRALHS